MSRKATGLVELYLGSTGKRNRRLIGSTVVDEWNSAIHGHVIQLKPAPKPNAEPKKTRKAKADQAEKSDPLMTEYPADKASRD